MESAKAFGTTGTQKALEVTYHFVITDTVKTVETRATVPRGNALERTVLRAFGRKTEKEVVNYQCAEGDPPPNILQIGGTVIDVWIFGSTTCLQVERSTLGLS
jgi:hypothetical protein